MIQPKRANLLPNPRAAYVWMLLSASSFSVMSFLTHLLKDSFSWQMIAVIRTAIALVLTLALARAAGAKLVFFTPATLWIRSLAGSVALLANFYSMTHYPVSEVLALSNMFPLWVAILSWPVLGEKPSTETWFAVVIGIAGVYLLQTQAQIKEGADFGAAPIITALVASIASSIALLGLHHLKEVSPSAVVAHFSGVSLICCIVALALGQSLTQHQVQHQVTGQDWLLLSVVGISATSGQLFLTKAFAAGSPARVSVISLSQVGITMLMEMAVLGRSFNCLTLLGIGLVVAPTAWVLLRRSR